MIPKEAIWFTPQGYNIGLVYGENNHGEKKFYLGVGLGIAILDDMQKITDWGAKFDLEYIQRFIDHCLGKKPEIIQTDQTITEQMKAEPQITDEWVLKELAHKLVQALSEEQLRKLFTVTILDPDRKETMEIFKDPKTDSDLRSHIYKLKYKKQAYFKIQLQL